MVYIREAHPSDGRRPIPNAPRSPKSDEERLGLASKCVKEMKLSIPCIVDDLKDTAGKAYAAWPDRIFVISKDMKIAYAGRRGPASFKPEEAKKVLKDLKEKK